MNLNELLQSILGVTGLPVEQDLYTGKEDKYILFSYEEETPTAFGDNVPIADTAYMKIQLVTPKNFDYFCLKKQIRKQLEAAGFSVTSIRSFTGDTYMGTDQIRQTVFEANYTTFRNKED